MSTFTISSRNTPCHESVSVFAAVLLAAAVTSGCKDEPKNAAAEGPPPPENLVAKEDPAVVPATTVLASANRFSNTGEVLGHVLLPNVSTLLKEVRDQLGVPQVAMFLDESFLRNIAAGQLGKRSNLAKNVKLDQPLGCAVVDPKANDVPLACFFAYDGGLPRLLGDLGDQGKQSDPSGHAALYRIDGKDVFLDELAGQVIVSGSSRAFEETKDYLQNNMIARGGKVATDIEAVAYGTKIMNKYEQELRPLLDMATQIEAKDATGDPELDKVMGKWNEYNSKSTRQSIERFSEIEQLSLGLSLEGPGFVARWAVFPIGGSLLEKESKLQAGKNVSFDLLGQLPASSWLVAGTSFDRQLVWEMESTRELRTLLVESYAELTKKKADDVRTAFDEFVRESIEIHGDAMAAAVVHEPDTIGGFVLYQPLLPGRSGRDSWKAWSRRFTPENVLGKNQREYVTWSFTAGAHEIDGVAVDRWLIEPTDAMKAELTRRAAKDSDLANLEKMLGGFKLVIDRIETNGTVVYVVAPGAEAVYAKAASTALAKGGATTNAGLARLPERHPSSSTLLAVDARGAMTWLKAILPTAQRAKVPEDLGRDLSDVSFATSYTSEGAQSGEIVVSQPFIDQIRSLVQKQR